MPNYNQTNDSGRVIAQAYSPNTMIEISELDSRQLGTWYINDQFVGYRIKLTTDKPEITADGQETATITATIYNWDDTIATDFAHDILFDVEGEQIPVTPTDGTVLLEYASEEPGTVTITTSNGEDQYVMSNDTVEVVAHD